MDPEDYDDSDDIEDEEEWDGDTWRDPDDCWEEVM